MNRPIMKEIIYCQSTDTIRVIPHGGMIMFWDEERYRWMLDHDYAIPTSVLSQIIDVRKSHLIGVRKGERIAELLNEHVDLSEVYETIKPDLCPLKQDDTGHCKYNITTNKTGEILIHTREVVLYGMEMRKLAGLDKCWVCINKLCEDNGVYIWLFSRNLSEAT